MSVRLSPKHGLNPCIPNCFFCNQPKNEILLLGLIRDGDREAPRNAVFDREPCDNCKQHMQAGVILVSTKNGETGDNPYRTGGWVVVTEAFIKRIVTPESLAQQILKSRFAFIPDETWDQIGLPRGKESAS